MWGEAICISGAILIAAFWISYNLDNIDETLLRILKRYAALENLGLFPGEDNNDRQSH